MTSQSRTLRTWTLRTSPSLRRRFLVLIACVAIVVTACGGSVADTISEAASDASWSGDDSGVSFDAADEQAEAATEDAAFDAEVSVDRAMAAEGLEPASTTGSAGTPPTAQLPDLGRDIIYTAELHLASTDISTATRNAISTIEGLGGFLFSQNTNGSANTSVLVFKVFPEQFQTALERLGSVGTVRQQSVSADDVTAIVVDLESRINTAEASVLRLRALLDEAGDIDVIASLENQLLDRETRLEQLRGQLRTVQNQVDLATITVHMSALVNRPGMAIELTPYAGHDSGLGCLVGPRPVPTDGATTLCVHITNVGDAPLTDIELDERGLGLDIDDFVAVNDTTDPLEPGESVVLIHEFDLTETMVLLASVEATALDDDGNPSESAKASTTHRRVDVADDGDLPGFGEVLGSSWNAVKTIAVLAALAVVAIAPFALVVLVLAPLALFAWRRLRAARPRRAATPPPPPAAAAATTAAADTPGDESIDDAESTVSA